MAISQQINNITILSVLWEQGDLIIQVDMINYVTLIEIIQLQLYQEILPKLSYIKD